MQMRREAAKREQHYQDAFKRRADIARADLLERLRTPERSNLPPKRTVKEPARESQTGQQMTPVYGGLLVGDGRGVTLPEVEASSYAPDSTPAETCNSRSFDSGSSYDSGSSSGGGSSGSFD
jgi:uncharacterized membrane protein YgcG